MPWKKQLKSGIEGQEIDMAKQVKAIELVFKAQPAMALVLELLKKQGDDDDPVADDIRQWLDDARELLKRRGNEI